MPTEAQKLADEKDFEIKMYRIGAAAEQVRPPRLVRVAVVQNAIVKPTTDPVKEQVGTKFNAAVSASWQGQVNCVEFPLLLHD